MDCKRCGKCCTGVGVAMPMNVDMAHFYHFHGYTIGKRADGNMELYLPGTCRYYQEGVGCTIHGAPERPQFCRDFYCDDCKGEE